jgi:hypothetical protein
MSVKFMLLAAFIFLGSLTLAESQTFVNGGVAGPNTALGWNFGYIANCATYVDGSNTFFFAYFQGGGYAYTNNPGFAILAALACQTGNLAGIFVTRLNPFFVECGCYLSLSVICIRSRNIH